VVRLLFISFGYLKKKPQQSQKLHLGSPTDTALFPKDGSYLVPLKKAIREKLKIELGDIVKIKATI
jgi:hypothetical protein